MNYVDVNKLFSTVSYLPLTECGVPFIFTLPHINKTFTERKRETIQIQR